MAETAFLGRSSTDVQSPQKKKRPTDDTAYEELRFNTAVSNQISHQTLGIAKNFSVHCNFMYNCFKQISFPSFLRKEGKSFVPSSKRLMKILLRIKVMSLKDTKMRTS